MCIFPSPTFSFSIIDYQNRPLPQPFTFLFKIFSKKSPFIFVSYLLMPYFCIRFPRDGQHLILTCCNGVGSALQNNKDNNFYLDHYYKSCYLCSPIRRARVFVRHFFPFRTERLGNKRRALRKKLPKTFGSLK